MLLTIRLYSNHVVSFDKKQAGMQIKIIFLLMLMMVVESK